MSLYLFQQRAELVLFAVWNHLCFWRRRRLVCVVIHGWWNLLLDIFEGTWVSMAAVKFSWMQFHRESGSSFMLNFFKKSWAKSSTSLLRCTRSAFFHSLMVWGVGFFLGIWRVLSMRTAAWSPRPATVELELMRSGQFVRKRSKMLLPRVGSLTICRSPASLNVSKNAWLMSIG